MTNATRPPWPPLAPMPDGVLMSFYDALRRVTDGERITKLEWGDDTYYAELRNGLLMLHKPEGWFAWTVSEADMVGTDWLAISK